MDRFNIGVQEGGLMVKDDEVFHIGSRCEVDGGCMVGMAPIALFVLYLFKRVLCVENERVGILKEL